MQFPPPPQSYKFQSRSITQTLNKQEAALKVYQIARVHIYTPTHQIPELFFQGLASSRNQRLASGGSCFALPITWICCPCCRHSDH